MKRKDKNASNGNFFGRAYLAITDFRWYPFVQREKLFSVIMYFLKLVIFATMAIALFFTLKFIVATDFIVENYNDMIPDFSLSDGVLEAKNKVNFEVSGNLIVIDTEQSNKDLRDTYDIENYSNVILVSNDAMESVTDNIVTIVNFSDLKDVEITKNSFYNDFVLKLSTPIFKVIMYLFTFPIVFVFYFINKAFNFIVLLLVTQMIGIFFNLKLSIKNCVRVVSYALTLPIIVEVVIWGIKGYVPDYASLAYHLLSFVYVFYAVRALKLDVLIIGSPEGMEQRRKVEEIIRINEEIEKANEEERKRILEEDKKEKDDSDEEH